MSFGMLYILTKLDVLLKLETVSGFDAEQHNIYRMDIKNIIEVIKPYTISGAASLFDVLTGTLVGVVIFIVQIWYRYKLKNHPIEDKIEYYENGQIKSSIKTYRK
jgi:hypothetical protein